LQLNLIGKMSAPLNQNVPFVQAPQPSDAIAASGITIPPALFITATQNDIVVAGNYYREAKRLCLQHPPQADPVDVINAKVNSSAILLEEANIISRDYFKIYPSTYCHHGLRMFSLSPTNKQ
jgi:hypothetical protein